MRPAFKKLLNTLEKEHQRVDKQINERYLQFHFQSQNTCADPKMTKEILTRFYWQLFCPELPINTHYNMGKNSVWASLLSVVKKEFGSNPEVTMADLVQSGAEGGLRHLCGVILKLTREHFQHAQAAGRITQYWNETDATVKIQDAKDYIQSFKIFLPIDQTNAGGTRLIANFRRVLEEHPKLMESKRILRR